jgi:hypothetical protein
VSNKGMPLHPPSLAHTNVMVSLYIAIVYIEAPQDGGVLCSSHVANLACIASCTSTLSTYGASVPATTASPRGASNLPSNRLPSPTDGIFSVGLLCLRPFLNNNNFRPLESGGYDTAAVYAKTLVSTSFFIMMAVLMYT